MSYLRFDKPLMTNLQESLPKEILRTNYSGAYSCSSIVDCNTRKYHGLLVVPVPEIDDDNHVLLSSLDETVIQHGAQFNLALHRYSGGTYSPNGHKYIREFDWDKLPTTIYRVGGVVLKKERVFQHFENRFLIRYTLLDAHSVTTLRLRPFLAFRSVKSCTHENSGASREYHVVDNGIATRMYSGYPMLYMQLNKKNEFIYDPNWYRGIEYQKEQELGYEFTEDLYVPGFFEFDIKKGESVVFSAGVNELKTNQLKKLFDHEYEVHAPRDSFQSCLINAAHQFHYEKDGENYIIAGYPWFKCRARDMFVSLPGLTLAIDEVDYYERAMQTAEKAINELKAQGIDVLGWVNIELRDLDSIEQAARTISEQYPQLSLLVNNAGIPGDMSVDSEHTEISDIRETLDVNFIGTFALTKALLPLLAKNSGRIANITVPSDISPYWHPLAYVASKAAQNAMMGVMAIEFQQSNTPVEVFSIHPGPTTTDLNGNMALPGFHDIETVGQKTAELINDGQNHQGEFIELYPIVKED